MSARYRLAALLLLIGVGGAAFWKFSLKARVRGLFVGHHTLSGSDLWAGQTDLERTTEEINNAFRYESAEAALSSSTTCAPTHSSIQKARSSGSTQRACRCSVRSTGKQTRRR
jgi:hypothetical protein